MSHELATQYVAYKFATLSRWEFRVFDDRDDEILDVGLGLHFVVFDTVNERNFCVIGDNELEHKSDVQKRVWDYALGDAKELMENSQMHDEWAHAITNGIVRGLYASRNAFLGENVGEKADDELIEQLRRTYDIGAIVCSFKTNEILHVVFADAHGNCGFKMLPDIGWIEFDMQNIGDASLNVHDDNDDA